MRKEPVRCRMRITLSREEHSFGLGKTSGHLRDCRTVSGLGKGWCEMRLEKYQGPVMQNFKEESGIINLHSSKIIRIN